MTYREPLLILFKKYVHKISQNFFAVISIIRNNFFFEKIKACGMKNYYLIDEPISALHFCMNNGCKLIGRLVGFLMKMIRLLWRI